MEDPGPPSADAIVVGAGRSRRMGVDKLAAPLAGRPLLAWTLEAMRAAPSVRRLILVVARERLAELRGEPWVVATDAQLVPGGARRQESVAAGLAASDAPVVLIHDAARPLVSSALVERVAATAAERGAALPVVPIADTVKRLDGDLAGTTIDRERLALAQTPQGVRRELLEAAYRRQPPAAAATFTDEASLLEAVGIAVFAVPGEASNLKVTVPDDLWRAEALLRSRLGPPRVGHGQDSHPFGPQDGLALGGLVMPEAPRLAGHSDGDAALHALADALLGAAGLGDLGRLYPAGLPETRGIASSELLRGVMRELRVAGYRPLSVDLTIVAGRPRLGAARLDAMRARIAELLELDPGSVGVKAATGNGSGPEGAGRAISATAVVVLAAVPGDRQ